MTPDIREARILYVINGLGTGGAERSLADMIDPLTRKGFTFTVACLFRRDEGVQAEVMANHRVLFVGPGRALSIRTLRSFIRDEKPDLVHTTVFEADILGRLSALGTGVPVVTSIVNTSYSRPARSNPQVPRAKLEAVRLIDGLTARHLTTWFHALTEAAKGEAVRQLGIEPERIEVIPRGRSSTRLGEINGDRRSQVRASLHISPTIPVLLSVGRREHQKGQIYALHALSKLRAKYPETVLLVAGRDGNMSTRLEAAAHELGITESVRFLGHRGDVPDLMCASDVLVFPSLYEGFGGTVIEAMAMGLPMVVSDLPVLREVAGEAALFAPTQQSDELAREVESLLADVNHRTRLRGAGLRRFADNFDIEIVANQMAAFYRNSM